MAASGYQFPVLSLEDLVCSLKSMDIRVEESDFRSPDQFKWQEIYCQILEQITDVPIEQILQQNLRGTEHFEYPELHEDSLPRITLTLALQRALWACGIQNFSVKDMIEPKMARLIKIGSAAVNFLRFKQSRMDVYNNVKEENERFREQYEYHLKNNEELKRKLEAIKTANAAQEPEIKIVQERIEAGARRMHELHNSETMLQKSVSEVKAVIAEKKAQIDQVKVALCKAKEEGDKLSNKIVQSPERVKEEQETMKHTLISLKAQLEQKRERLAEYKKKTEAIKQGKGNAEKALKMLREIQKEIDNEKVVADEIAQIMEHCQEQRNFLRDIQTRKEQLNQLLANRQEKLAKLSIQHQNKTKAIGETEEQFKEEIDILKERQNKDMAKKSATHQEKQRVVEAVKAKQREQTVKIDEIKNMYSEIIERVDKYHTDVAQNWEEYRQFMKNKETH